MESSSSVSRLPSFENLRRGQGKVVDIFRTQEVVTAQLPTGYGKTRTAACSYLTLRARGVCNRMLYIVPRSAQAKQAADGLPDADITVLVAYTRKDDPHVDTWPGWWSGEHWMDADGDLCERQALRAAA